MQKHPTLSLVEHFKDLPEPRVDRTKAHALIDVLIIGVCTLLCGGEGFNDMEDFGKAKEQWFRTFLTLANGIPSHDTFNRVFAALDPKKFLECFLRWTQSLRQTVHQQNSAKPPREGADDRAMGEPKWAVRLRQGVIDDPH